MSKISNQQINKEFGMIFQEYRLKNKITQEKFAEKLEKSTKTISQIETGKDGTSKKTDIDFMNFLGITPNNLYKRFMINPKIKRMIEVEEKINQLTPDKMEALLKIVEILENL